MSFTITVATKEDAVGILEIYKPVVEQTAASFEQTAPTLLEIQNRIEKVNKTHVWLVAKKNGMVAGYAYGSRHRSRAAYDTSTEVSAYTNPNFQRQGLATILYEKLFSVLTAQGYCLALAGITLPNLPSQQLHAKFGFEAFAKYENIGFKLNAWHHTEWWRKQLREPLSAPTPLLHFSKVIDLL